MEIQITTMNDLYNKCFDWSNDPIVNKIKETIKRYQLLGMKEMTTQAITGAVAFTLSKFNMTLIHASIPHDFFDGFLLNKIDFEGSKQGIYPSVTGKNNWNQILLKDFNEIIPFDILQKIPSDWGEKAVVFTPKIGENPIIAIPIGTPAYKMRINTTKWFGLIPTIKVKQSNAFYASVFQWE